MLLANGITGAIDRADAEDVVDVLVRTKRAIPEHIWVDWMADEAEMAALDRLF